MVTILGLDTRIYQSLPFPAAHTNTTITVKQRKVRLITEDTVPPVSEFRNSVHSPTHTAVSPVIQSQSGTPGGTTKPIASSQNPVYNAPNWQPPPKSTDHLHAQSRSRDETIVPDHSVSLSVFLGCGRTSTTSPTPRPSSASIASQNFADASLQHIQNYCHFLLRIALTRQSYTTHQYLLLHITRHDALKDW